VGSVAAEGGRRKVRRAEGGRRKVRRVKEEVRRVKEEVSRLHFYPSTNGSNLNLSQMMSFYYV
jgi:UDP-N-acetylglucosamine 2-epimerase